MSFNKKVSDAHINYMLYKNKHLYTDDKETTTEIMSYLYKIYYDEYKKQSDLKVNILKSFSERFPSIKMPCSQLEYYLYCCELYASHQLKGIEYNLPFPVETDVPTQEDFKLGVEATQHNSSQPEVSLNEFVEILRTKTPSIIGIKEKKKNVKKHTLSILLTQEKQKNRKLQDILAQTSPT
jgi:hypothetical protein